MLQAILEGYIKGVSTQESLAEHMLYYHQGQLLLCENFLLLLRHPALTKPPAAKRCE